MTIKQMIEELEELKEHYNTIFRNKELSISTREYYLGKRNGIGNALRYLKYFEEK